MTDARLVLIVGSPRSGTTWLQTLLGAHPAVASPQETDLFRMYLQPLAQSWDRQVAWLRDTSDDRRRKGLPTVIDAARFEELGRGFVEATMDAVREQKPGAHVVVEKSPGHSTCTDVIERFWPEATFIHVIRDGRDVTASLVAASTSYGKNFAPGSVTRAARMWRTRLEGARQAADAPGGYLEVRYEALHADGPATLQRAYAACGVDVPVDECVAVLERFEFDKVARSGTVASSILTGGEFSGDARTRVEPKGFFRKGVVGGWRDEWAYAERFDFDAGAGDMLIDLGYEADHSWVGAGHAPKHRAHSNTKRTARVLRGLAARLERLGSRKDED